MAGDVVRGVDPPGLDASIHGCERRLVGVGGRAGRVGHVGDLDSVAIGAKESELRDLQLNRPRIARVGEVEEELRRVASRRERGAQEHAKRSHAARGLVAGPRAAVS